MLDHCYSEWFYAEFVSTPVEDHKGFNSDDDTIPSVMHYWGRYRIAKGDRVMVRHLVFPITHWHGTAKEYTAEFSKWDVVFLHQGRCGLWMNDAAARIYLKAYRKVNGKVAKCTDKDSRNAADIMKFVQWEMSR